MKDVDKTKAQLIEELKALRQKSAELKTSISERERMEEVLRESETRMRAIVTTAVDGIITIDERGTVESFNPAAAQIFGYEPTEVIGQNVKILMPEPYHKEHYGYLANYLHTGKAKIIGSGREVIGRRKDGTSFPIDLAVSEVRLGDRRIFTGIVRDLTQRKQAEETLRQSEERFRIIAEATPVPVAITRVSDGMVLYANKQLGLTFGLSAKEMIGRKTLDFYYNPADRQVLLDKLSKEGFLQSYEVQAKKADGTPFWVSVTIQPLIFNSESALFSVYYDITERKQHEREQAALLQLSQAFLATLDPQAVMEQAVEIISQVLGEEHILLGLPDEKWEKMVVHCARGWKRNMLGLEVSLERWQETTTAYALKRQEPILIEDAVTESRSRIHPVAIAEGMRSGIVVPMLAEGKPLGVLVVCSPEPFRFTVTDLHLLSLIANQTAVALERAQLTEEVQHREKRFRSLVENALDFIVVLGADGTICYDTVYHERALGYEPGELRGKSAFEFIHPDDLPDVLKAFSCIIQNPNVIQSAEFRFRRRDGSWRVIEAIGKNLLDNPAVAGIVVNARDTTERKQKEKEQAALLQLSQAFLTTLDPQAVMEQAAGAISQMLGEERVLVYLLDEKREKAVVHYARGWTRDMLGLEISLTESRFHIHPKVMAEGARSGIAAPLIAEGKPVGALTVNSLKPFRFTSAGVHLLSLIANQTAVALQRAQLYTERKRMEKALRQVQEGERRRIARELHDGVAQTLSGLLLHLGSLGNLVESSSPVREHLEQIKSLVGQALQDMRGLVWTLRPTLLDDLGLVDALRGLLTNLSQGAPARIALHIDESLPPLSSAVETALYRIVQEALSNVFQHARASQVRVHLGTSNGALQLTVADNGQGIDPTALSATSRDEWGIGLWSMRERAEEIGGTFSLRSSGGQGTTIVVRVPYGVTLEKEEGV
jgi:PAS domain S-box-containing protein